jgi:hypothetical protein
MSFLNRRVRIHRWVLWWMVVGIVCGVVAVTNILERNLSRAQERVLLAMGVMNWILGGLVCYACDGIRLVEPPHPSHKTELKALPSHDQDRSYAPSEFILPGNRKSLLPPKYR